MIRTTSLALADAAQTPRTEHESMSLREQLSILERQIVLQTLTRFNWVRKDAALELGIDPLPEEAPDHE